MIEAASFWSLIEKRAVLTPDDLLAVDEQDRTITFAGLASRAECVAAGLTRLGLGTGSSVSWVMPTRIDTLILTAVLARIGAI